MDLLKVRDQEIFDVIQHSDLNTVGVKRTLLKKALAQLVFLVIQRQAHVVREYSLRFPVIVVQLVAEQL